MGMNVANLISYLRLEGPYDEDLLLTASEKDAPPPGDESYDEGEAIDKEENSEKEPSKEKDEPMEEEDLGGGTYGGGRN